MIGIRAILPASNAMLFLVASFSAAPARAEEASCRQWDVSGRWIVSQSNGATVHMDLQQVDNRVSGSADYSAYDNAESRVQTVGGPVTGYLESGKFLRVTTHWSNSTAGIYTGQVESSQRIAGNAVEKNNPGNRATFRATDFTKCKDFGVITPPSATPPQKQADPVVAPAEDFREEKRSPTFPSAPTEVGPGLFQIHGAGPDPAAAAWAQAGRLAAEQCSRLGFVGGHFSGHHKDGDFGLICARDGAVWRDARLAEIASTEWSFADVNQVNWAQANRAAERLCAAANLGFAGGHFNDHMVDGKFGLYCYAGAAQWFDASDVKLAATGFGFATPKLDDVPWHQAMRAATNFCMGKGFTGVFMNGHQAPNRYGVVCQK